MSGRGSGRAARTPRRRSAPPRVTAAPEPGQEGRRLTVYVDGKRAFTAPPDLARRLVLSQDEGGQRGTSGAGDAAELTRARDAALRLLAVRARTRAELCDRLQRRGIEPGAVSRVLSALEGAGLVDDGAFARLWAEERMRLRPVGSRRLARELLSKGIPAMVVSEVVAETYRRHPEEDVAREVLAKRLRRVRRGDWRRERARAYAFLLRRGFSRGVASRVLRERERETCD